QILCHGRGVRKEQCQGHRQTEAQDSLHVVLQKSGGGMIGIRRWVPTRRYRVGALDAWELGGKSLYDAVSWRPGPHPVKK
ncbi:MAG: hypothetical protein VX936_06165, partial [Planctomycetota bacterium]|nr:hypothetical protein [Planctomycetota bacterium]